MQEFLAALSEDALGEVGKTTPSQRALLKIVEGSNSGVDVTYTKEDGFRIEIDGCWQGKLADEDAAMAIGAKELRRR